MEFKLLGTLTGYKAGESRNTITVKPQNKLPWVEKDDRQTSFIFLLSEGIQLADLPHGKLCVFHGECARTYHDWVDPVSKRSKDIENIRFKCLRIEPVKV